ncbi:OXA1L mitochondrial inner membrane protein [Xylocopa sonorina]|uniref:OXA1L mitochondrial inner membrane protein n=1 Tax=Xylocopa sonorina TaxID=1818115 RepID=UPI00403A7F6C
MFTRLFADIGRKFLSPTAGFQKITECQFSRLAHNSINRRLEEGIIFNNHKHSKVYGIYLVRYESTINVTGKETVSNIPSAQPQDVININDAVPEKDLLSEIPEPPVPLTEGIVEAIKVHANGEPTFESLGLGGYSPIGLIQSYFEWLHISCDMPWWLSVVVTALFIKIVTFPLAIDVQRNTSKLQNVLPEMVELQDRLTQSRRTGNVEEAALHSYDLQQFFKRNKIKMFPISSFIRIGVHIPIFIALRQMAAVPVESLKDGGLWWFADLTASDPYYILPLCSSVSMLLVTEYAMKNASANQVSAMMRYFIRAIPLVSFLFAAHFPGMVLCHWVTSNIVTVIQNEALKMNSVKRIFKIPLPIQHPQSARSSQLAKKNFREAFSDSWSNMKVSNKLADYARADMIQFNEAAKGPLKKTFKYNPLKDIPKENSAASMSALKK